MSDRRGHLRAVGDRRDAPLTRPQVALIEANVGYARSLARKAYRDDEYESVACEALCEAARTYVDDGRASFSTFLFTVVKRRMTDFYRHWHKTRTVGRQAPVELTEMMIDAELDQRRPFDVAVAEEIDNAALILLLRPTVRADAMRIAAGETQAAVAADAGVTASAVSLRFKAERQRLASHRRAA